MFKRIGSVISAEKISLAEWRKLIIEASIHSDVEKIPVTAEFELDKDNFLYVRVRAVSSLEAHGANQNGDGFPAEELEKSYRTFIRRGVYINHESEDPSKAIGIILDAAWHKKQQYVELLLAIDKNEPIAKKIENGLASTWSMGSLVKECACSICEKRCTSEADYCDHLKNHMGREYNGKKVFALNYGCNFYEISNVTVPADPQAYTLQVLAEKKEILAEKFLLLADSYKKQVEDLTKEAGSKHCADCSKNLSDDEKDGNPKGHGGRCFDCAVAHDDKEEKAEKKEAGMNEASTEKDVVAGVQQKLQKKEAEGNKTEQQILGAVRHKLKIATATLLPREGDRMRQRIQSALDAGNMQAEKKSKMITENKNPLEGINVENNLTIKYIPGDSLSDCYFVAKKGKLQAFTTASSLLDPKEQKKILAEEAKAEEKKEDEKEEKEEKKEAAQKPAERLKDDSKPTPDHTLTVGDEEAQPGPLTKNLGPESAEIKDDSKPTPDHTMTMGKDPNQPSDVVKKYAQAIGAKNVTFKKGEDGGFTAFLSSGSITSLARLWNTVPKLVREAKIAGESPSFAREEAPLTETDNRSDPVLAREDMKKHLAKPGSTGAGAEMKSYFQGYSTKDLSAGGEEGWARKVNELTKVAGNLEAQVKALSVENDVLKKSLDAVKMAAVEEKKMTVIGSLIDYMERAGALKVDANDMFDLKEQGLNHEQAQAKAYSNVIERKKAELKSLDLKALQTMLSNMSEFVPQIRSTASKKNLDLPRTGREESTGGDEADRLAKGW